MKKLNVKSPQFLSDLYADLRDRRLLVPVAALLVALVAVPVVLSSSGSSSVSSLSSLAASADDATEVEPAVLVEELTGVRSYRKRLAALKSKNPFKQKFALPTPGSVELEPEGSAPSAATASTAATSSIAPADDALADAAQSVSDAVTEPAASPSSSGGDSGTSSQPSEPPKPQVRFYAGRVDVKLGPTGETKDYEGVRRLDFLPGDKNPLVVFIGLSEDGKRAIFSLSSAFTGTSGEGSCAPKEPSPCQFLTLKVAEERQLTLGGDEEGETAETYRLKLLKTHIVRVPDPRGD